LKAYQTLTGTQGGVNLNELSVDQLFDFMGINPTIEQSLPKMRDIVVNLCVSADRARDGGAELKTVVCQRLKSNPPTHNPHCQHCKGHGIVVTTRTNGSYNSRVQERCGCAPPNGAFIEDRKEDVSVNIPANTGNGTELRLYEKGNESPGALTGDIVVVIQVLPVEEAQKPHNAPQSRSWPSPAAVFDAAKASVLGKTTAGSAKAARVEGPSQLPKPREPARKTKPPPSQQSSDHGLGTAPAARYNARESMRTEVAGDGGDRRKMFLQQMEVTAADGADRRKMQRGYTMPEAAMTVPSAPSRQARQPRDWPQEGHAAMGSMCGRPPAALHAPVQPFPRAADGALIGAERFDLDDL